jgi:hypothetical protein
LEQPALALENPVELVDRVVILAFVFRAYVRKSVTPHAPICVNRFVIVLWVQILQSSLQPAADLVLELNAMEAAVAVTRFVMTSA